MAGSDVNIGLAKFYTQLGQTKPSTTIAFFDRAEFYSIFGSDATYLAREIRKSSGALKHVTIGDRKVDYLTLNKNQFETVVKELLLVRLYRVEVYQSLSKTGDWKVAYQASPGNLTAFEDLLFGAADMTTTCGVMSLMLSKSEGVQMVSMAYFESNSRTIWLSEFADDDSFINLEACLVQFNPKECLLPSGDVLQACRIVVERHGALITERKRKDFSSADISQDLQRLLRATEKADSYSLQTGGKAQALSCMAAIIKYLELLSDESNFGQFVVAPFDLKQYARLDGAAIRALDVFPTLQHQAASQSRQSSLLDVLDHCRTVQGRRLLNRWLRQPLLDVNKIEERLNAVEIFVSNSLLRQSLHDEYLAALPDLQRVAKRLTSSKRAGLQTCSPGQLFIAIQIQVFSRRLCCRPGRWFEELVLPAFKVPELHDSGREFQVLQQDCYRIHQTLQKLPVIEEALTSYSGVHQLLLTDLIGTPMKELLGDMKKFSDMVLEVLDMEFVENGEFLIKSDFDDELKAMSVELRNIEKKMQSELRKAAAELGIEASKIKMDSNAQYGNFFRIGRKDDNLLRGNRSFQVVDTKKDGVRFTNAALRQLSDDYCSTKDSYVEHQKNVVVEIMKIAGGYVEPVYKLGELIGLLDAFVGLAHAATCSPMPYVRPKLLPAGSGILKLYDVRHPCVECQDCVTYIPNDAEFDSERALFHLITGPNMGGKSTYIRSVGVAVLMAQIGSYVPCREAEISIVDSILVRVGASDCQAKGISTFMQEMLESSSILKAATQSSLVIIDELGRGTSTYDGFGLAWAISHYISTKIKCFTLFATHFHELTLLANEVPTVDNLHVTAVSDDDILTLLYKVEKGVCDQSFGLHVAKMARFPKRVLENAQAKARDLEDYCCEPAKRQKLDLQEAANIVRTIQGELAHMSDAEALEHVGVWRNLIKDKCYL